MIMEIRDTKVDFHVENYLTFFDFLIFRKTFKKYKKATGGDLFSKIFNKPKDEYSKSKKPCFERHRFKSETSTIKGKSILQSLFDPIVKKQCLFDEISQNYVELLQLTYKICLDPFISPEYSSLAKFMSELVTLAPNLLFSTKKYKLIYSFNQDKDKKKSKTGVKKDNRDRASYTKNLNKSRTNVTVSKISTSTLKNRTKNHMAIDVINMIKEPNMFIDETFKRKSKHVKFTSQKATRRFERMHLDLDMTVEKYHKHAVRKKRIDLYQFNYKVIQKIFKPFYQDLKYQIGKLVGLRDLNEELANYQLAKAKVKKKISQKKKINPLATHGGRLQVSISYLNVVSILLEKLKIQNDQFQEIKEAQYNLFEQTGVLQDKIDYTWDDFRQSEEWHKLKEKHSQLDQLENLMELELKQILKNTSTHIQDLDSTKLGKQTDRSKMSNLVKVNTKLKKKVGFFSNIDQDEESEISITLDQSELPIIQTENKKRNKATIKIFNVFDKRFNEVFIHKPSKANSTSQIVSPKNKAKF